MVRVLFAPGFAALVVLAIPSGPAVSAELPSFVSPLQLSPLQDAMNAQAASADDAAQPLPSFIDTRANRTLSHMLQSARAILVLDRELAARGAPDLTASDFPATLHSARRDAGETRALADEVSRRAAELSEGLAGLSPAADPAPSLTVAAGAMPSTPEAVTTVAPVAAAAPPPRQPSLATAANTDAGTASSAVTASVPLPAAHDVATTEASAVAPQEPLPGRMGLGFGAHMPETDAPAMAAPVVASVSGAPATVVLAPQRDAAAEPNATPQPDTPPAVPARAMLTPPSRPSGHVSESPRPQKVVAAPKPANPSPTAKPGRAVASHATDSPPRQRQKSVAAETSHAAAASTTAPNSAPAPALASAQPQVSAGGIFSWLKPLAGKVDVPRDITALGWASN